MARFQICSRNDRASLGVGHQAARAENAPEAAYFAHHIGRGNRHIELQPAALNAVEGFIVIHHHIGASITGGHGASPCAKTATRTVLPSPLGRTTTSRTRWSAWRGHLIRRWTSTVASNFVKEAPSPVQWFFGDRAYRGRLCRSGQVFFRVSTFHPPRYERICAGQSSTRLINNGHSHRAAVPSICFIAPSMSMAFRSFILVSAIWRSWARVIFADLVLVRRARAFVNARRLADERTPQAGSSRRR